MTRDALKPIQSLPTMSHSFLASRPPFFAVKLSLLPTSYLVKSPNSLSFIRQQQEKTELEEQLNIPSLYLLHIHSWAPQSLLFLTFLIISLSYILSSTNLLLTKNNKHCSHSTLDPILFQNRTLTLTEETDFASSLQQTIREEVNEDEQDEKQEQEEDEQEEQEQEETNLNHIVFCIAASSDLWNRRKEYIKKWWIPDSIRAYVWLNQKVRRYRNERLPEIMISSDTSKFPYKHRQGSRSALRLSRIVSETLRLKPKNVRWFVMGDDDTVFMTENVKTMLQQFDHRQHYYIGSNSESHIQNLLFSYNMAYGGGGFAISYPLAVELEKMQDGCMRRYAHLYGSDDRIHACMAELGVPLTKHPGFHQYDIYGDPIGLLVAHPTAPLISLHHLDVIDTIFPSMSQPRAIGHLFHSVRLDPASIMQQSMCYHRRNSWSIHISWGYAIQVIRGIFSPRELELPSRTFQNWYRKANYFAYSFSTRPVLRNPCHQPFTYYITQIKFDSKLNQTVSVYSRWGRNEQRCRWKQTSPKTVNTIVVYKQLDPLRWHRAPRRDCCSLMETKRKSTLHITVRNCGDDEFSGL